MELFLVQLQTVDVSNRLPDSNANVSELLKFVI